MNRLLLLFIALFLNLMNASAQIQFIAYDTVRVSKNDTLLKNAWAGGLNSPQFSTLDLNGDSKDDLVAFERDFYGAVKTFINEGKNGEIAYAHAPEYQPLFPAMNNWMLLRDYDCDGKADLFTSVPAGIAVYRNTGTDEGVPKFTKVSNLLQRNGPNGQAPIYVSTPDIPAIDDIDGDGDLDILSFDILGNRVVFYRNLSYEENGNCSMLKYELGSSCWGYFSEAGNTNSVTLYDTCDNSYPAKGQKHAGSTLLTIDLNGNGLKDLLLGDITYPNLVRLTNGGTQQDASITEAEESFPDNTTPVDLRVFPASYHIDVNNDKLNDLIVAPNNPNTSENHDQIWYYQNTGNNDMPAFQFQKTDFLVNHMIDVGERSFPVFVDENADGLMDIMIGSYGYFINSGNYSSRLMLLRNTGTAKEPSFEIVTDDYGSLSQLEFNGLYPAFGDMDMDGDMDMITGDEEGNLHYFRNDGGMGNSLDLSLSKPFYFDIDIGMSAKPQITDLNDDGLPDLLVGERSGTLNYFENTGTPDEAAFSELPTNDNFGEIDVMKECCTGYSSPFMSYDSLGNKIIYVGSEQGKLYLFGDIDANLQGSFSLLDSLYLHGVNITPAVYDLNNDNKPELAYGEYAGGIGLLKQGNPPGLGIADSPAENTALRIFPNPASDMILLTHIGLHAGMDYQLVITNLLGQRKMIASGKLEKNELMIDVQSLKAGPYVIKLFTGQHTYSGKFLIKHNRDF